MTTPTCIGVKHKSLARWAWVHGNTALFLNKKEKWEIVCEHGLSATTPNTASCGDSLSLQVFEGWVRLRLTFRIYETSRGKAEMMSGLHFPSSYQYLGLRTGTRQIRARCLGFFKCLFMIYLSTFTLNSQHSRELEPGPISTGAPIVKMCVCLNGHFQNNILF